MTSEEITKELARIIKAISDLNECNTEFDAELHIVKKYGTTNANSLLSLGRVMTLVCEKYGTTPEEVSVCSRRGTIVLARQICHYMALMRTKKSDIEVGIYFGNKDRATVRHSKKTVQNLLDTSRSFSEEWDEFLKTAK